VGHGVGGRSFSLANGNEAWFTKTPGLKVAISCFSLCAKELLITAINDPKPVLFLNTKPFTAVYIKRIPEAYYTHPVEKRPALGERRMTITIVSIWRQVFMALEVLDKASHNQKLNLLVSKNPASALE